VLEVFVAALESNVLLLRSEGEQSAWLWRVLYNKVADYSRHSMRRTAAPLEEVAQTVSIDDASLYIDNLSFFL
jgi:DNA-directed RNA polymerase specialized sigma24 family protein